MVSLVLPDGAKVGGDAYAFAADALVHGKILALKGAGGFELVVQAEHLDAVAKLRRLKRSPARPFAVACRDLAEARRLAELSAHDEHLLTSPARPIVLVRRRADAPLAPSTCGASHLVGLTLPSSPIHHLLFQAGGKRLTALAITSANHAGEPPVVDCAEALTRLEDLCDLILWHDSPIPCPMEPSIVRPLGQGDLIVIRRGRGEAPTEVRLPGRAVHPGACVGGEMSNTVAVVRDGVAIVGPHLGDLAHPRAYHVFRQALSDLAERTHVRPQWIAHDLNPAFLSTIHAKQTAAERSIPAVAVQHHHAHAAAVLAEHHSPGPALALVFDRGGQGTDGTTWGGELLAVDVGACKRVARLRPLRLAGGNGAAANGPRRCALALLHLTFGDSFAFHPLTKKLVPHGAERDGLVGVIAKEGAGVLTSAAGAYVDAMAVLLGVMPDAGADVDPALMLEAAAAGVTPAALHGGFQIVPGKPAELDLTPAVREILTRQRHGVPKEQLAAVFLEQLALGWDAVIARAVEKTGLLCVALSGDLFCNAILTTRLVELLTHRGLDVLRHRDVPPGDGGLSLGQAAVAAARLSAAAAGNAMPSAAGARPRSHNNGGT